MTILILERVPAKLRGELSRWLIEPRTGVFVGRISALVRERLWEQVTTALSQAKKRGRVERPAALLIYRAKTEQGLEVRAWGDPSRELWNCEGLTLVRVPHAFRKEKPGTPPEPEE